MPTGRAGLGIGWPHLLLVAGSGSLLTIAHPSASSDGVSALGALALFSLFAGISRLPNVAARVRKSARHGRHIFTGILHREAIDLR